MLENLSNHLLIASPGIEDAVFSKSVVYIYEQTDQGIVGFIINKPLPVRAENVLPYLSVQLDADKLKDLTVFLGGTTAPEQGLIIYQQQINKYNSNILIYNKNNYNFPDYDNNFLVVLGYSFWEPQELDTQILKNDWLIAPFESNIVFGKDIYKKWGTALASIGVSLSAFSEVGGHG
jgi:putative transcriptional regulator